MTIAFVFPGQGSQSIGMMSELADKHSIVKETFDTASEQLGFDLWQLIQEGPEEALNSTENTQPALLASSIAAWRVWHNRTDIKPQMLAGHSLGEYSALVAANVIDFKDAISLVRGRGRLMQAAVAPGEGAMAAILGLDDDTVVSICTEESSEAIVSAANFNSPAQVVIAGQTAAVERVIKKAKTAGAKRSLLLPVSVPSHCALMTEAAENLAAVFDKIEFKPAMIPVIQNVNAEVQAEPATIKSALLEQLYKPVQWTNCIKALSEQGVDQIVECGPGKVLSGLIKRIDRNIDCLPFFDSSSLEKAIEKLTA